MVSVIAVLGSEMAIPVVDVSTACCEEVESGVVQQIHTAFSTVGFVFITGHGIPRQLVRAVTLDSKLYNNYYVSPTLVFPTD